MTISKDDSRKAVMDATQTAMKIFRQDNPLPVRPDDEYFDRQHEFINAYVFAHVPEETRLAAI